MKEKKNRAYGILICGLVAGAQLYPTHVNAGEILSPCKSCHALQVLNNECLEKHSSDAIPNLTDAVRSESGELYLANQNYANDYCLSQGLRLPTAREFALYAQNLGAHGIRETAFQGSIITSIEVKTEIAQMENDGYFQILIPVLTHELPFIIDFYFNPTGYRRPGGDIGNPGIFWTSSSGSHGPLDAYAIRADDGFFKSFPKTSRGWIRCVQSPGKNDAEYL